MRFTMIAMGMLLLLMGLLWMAQGAGWVHWPQSSFMLDQRPWIWRGLALAVAGLAVILIGRRRGR